MDDEHVLERIGHKKRTEAMGQSVDYLLDDRYGAKAELYPRTGKGQSLRPSKTHMKVSKDHSVISDKTQQINKGEGNLAMEAPNLYQDETKSERASEDTIERYKNELARKFKTFQSKRETLTSDGFELKQEPNRSRVQHKIDKDDSQNSGTNSQEILRPTNNQAISSKKTQPYQNQSPSFKVENVQIPSGVFDRIARQGLSEKRSDFQAQNTEATHRARKGPNAGKHTLRTDLDCDQTLEEFRVLKEQYRKDMLLHSQYLRNHGDQLRNGEMRSPLKSGEIPKNQSLFSATGLSPMISPRDFGNLDFAQLNMRISQNRTNTSPNATKVAQINKQDILYSESIQPHKEMHALGVGLQYYQSSANDTKNSPDTNQFPGEMLQRNKQRSISEVNQDAKPSADSDSELGFVQGYTSNDKFSSIEYKELNRLRELQNLNKIKQQMAEELSKSQLLDQILQEKLSPEGANSKQQKARLGRDIVSRRSEDSDLESSELKGTRNAQNYHIGGQGEVLKTKLSAISRSGKFDAINADEIMKKKTQLNLQSLRRQGTTQARLQDHSKLERVYEDQGIGDQYFSDQTGPSIDFIRGQRLFQTMDTPQEEQRGRSNQNHLDNRHYFSTSKIASNPKALASHTPEYTGAQSPFLDSSSIEGKSNYREFMLKNNMSLSQLSQISQSKKSVAGGSTRQKTGSFLNIQNDKSATKRQFAHNHSVSAINYQPFNIRSSQSKRNYSINPQMDTIVENKNDLSGYLKSQNTQVDSEPVRLKSININVAEQKIQMILSNGQTSTRLIEQSATQPNSVYDPTQKLAARRQDISRKREDHIRELQEAYQDEFQDSSNIFEKSEFKYDQYGSLRPSNFSKDYLNEKNLASQDTSFLPRDFSSKSRPTIDQNSLYRSTQALKTYNPNRPGDLRQEIRSHYLTEDRRYNSGNLHSQTKKGSNTNSSRTNQFSRPRDINSYQQELDHPYSGENEATKLASKSQLYHSNKSSFDPRPTKAIHKVPSQSGKISLQQKGPSISRREVIEILKLHKAVQNKIQEMQNLKIQDKEAAPGLIQSTQKSHLRSPLSTLAKSQKQFNFNLGRL